MIILAIVNGGLGLSLAANTHGGEIAYGVVAGVIGVVYIAAVVIVAGRAQRDKQREKAGSS